MKQANKLADQEIYCILWQKLNYCDLAGGKNLRNAFTPHSEEKCTSIKFKSSKGANIYTQISSSTPHFSLGSLNILLRLSPVFVS